MAGLKIELILRLLTHGAQVRPQGRFGNRLGVVILIPSAPTNGFT